MIEVTIDGKSIEVESGITILEASRKLGIDIPTFCLDDNMEPQGLCRICVVEIKGFSKLFTSCSTVIDRPMEIFTESENVVESRKMLLDLLLSNHDFDCVNCQKSGACKLQEYCLRYNIEKTSFNGRKNTYKIDDSNEFYLSNQNKCILCKKCVKMCSEIQCTSAITESDSGFITRINTPMSCGLKESTCVSCGNCVAVCPVGALVPKYQPYRHWEVSKVKTTCTYCGVGCQLNLIVKDSKVVGVESNPKGPNKGLLCVKGRFSYNFINHRDRLKKPLVKINGKFEEFTWDAALTFIKNRITYIREKNGADSIGILSSARCTNEENYLLQKFARVVLGTNNIDHCARL